MQPARHRRRTTRTPLFLALVAGVAVIATGNARTTYALPITTVKTLTRLHDPVIVPTRLLSDFADHATGHYRLYAAADGGAVPIPFQFDARDKNDELVLSDDGHVGDFAFDDNDELVFMAKDAGARLDPVALPADADAMREIRIFDRPQHVQAWVYLAHFPGSPPPGSDRIYATFDVAANEVHGTFYTMKYYPGRNFFTGMRILPAAGGTGENMLDRMKVRLQPELSLLLTTWSPLFTEEDFVVKIDGFKNGPVRAIRRVRQSLDLGHFFPDMPSGTVYTYYYFSSFTTPSRFSIPWVVMKAMRTLHFSGASDFRSNVLGMTYYDGANPDGLPFTGKRRKPRHTDVDHSWWALSGKGGTCLHTFLIPGQWRKWGIVRGTVFVDDDNAIDEHVHEAQAGTHEAGYSLLNMQNLKKAGSYDMSLAMFILPKPYELGDEKKPLLMFDRPLEFSVTPIARVARRPAASGVSPHR